jgi:SAM-dependent methyltransferase
MNQEERYNKIWEYGDVQKPEAWSLWDVIKNFKGKNNLEIGPGNYPKISIKSGFFIDISKKATKNLKRLGANARIADATALPFENGFFDLVVAMEVLEHIENDKKALLEIVRVLKPSGNFLFSVPLRMELYDEWDQAAGHYRRYEIKELTSLLSEAGFKVLKYRHPSFYPKLINILMRRLYLTKVYFKFSKNKKGPNFPQLPKFLFNLFTKGYAFLEKKGAPQWQTEIENLKAYKEGSIAIFCQRKV